MERLGLEYEPVNADEDGRQEVIRLSGQRAIPILTIGEEVIVDSSTIIRELRRRYAYVLRGSSELPGRLLWRLFVSRIDKARPRGIERF